MGAAAGWAVVEADMGELVHREMACYNNNNIINVLYSR